MTAETVIYLPVFLLRRIYGGAGPSGQMGLARLNLMLQEVLKIYDR